MGHQSQKTSALAASTSGSRSKSLLAMRSSLAMPTMTFKRAQSHVHLMGHEGAKLGEAEIVSVGFVEDLLGCIEGVYDQTSNGRREADLL